ncbi:ThiF family adenylyltransferase [Bradyrhizobium sp. CCBAU 11361]|uniref:ThiF family adenylyltransferase n=1 Tax=Bradyrhizobium sp. CCBAU 11361 TaxID=1630812 RepID=UPI002306825F|nr:ThiF family adenylyltransferase [Bradyrhizobium sp. CCBAU 11361]MDA9492353.1 molybdopterin biosynthesis protein [Bradyrhizobium sp. CCBAU 11361]
MPNASHPLAERFDAAVAAVESRWEELGLQPRRLDRRELAAYRGRAAEKGWRFAAEFPGGLRRLDVIVSAGFPFVPARVALVDRPAFLAWPHVEKDGVLCLFPDTTTMSVDDPYDGVISLLDEALTMVKAAIRGELDSDFRTEFLTYWHHAERGGDRTVLSLLDPGPPSRRIRIWEGASQTVVAESDDQLIAWLRNAAPKVAASKIKSCAGAFVWLDRVPIPSEYPSSAKDVYALAERGGGADLLDELALETLPRTFVLFGALAEAGPALATSVVNRPAVVRGRDPLSAGFRSSAIPDHVVRARLFGGAPCDRNSVERVDPAWIHGRDRDARVPRLRDATVAVLGCGSVGAPVAHALARAGVGKFILVDKQVLKSANVGRHTLGVQSIDDPKSPAVAQQIRVALPHVEVVHNVLELQELLLRRDDPVAKADLIVSAMGDWPAESLLDEWHAAQGRHVPIVYGWTEPHAAAGHAIAISAPGDSLRADLDAYGSPHLVAVRWAQDPRRYEPACGAAFDPYGPVELGFVTSMVAQAALDALLGQVRSGTHRIWLARRAAVEAAGGTWSDELRAIAPNALDGATIVERRWGRSARILAA